MTLPRWAPPLVAALLALALALLVAASFLIGSGGLTWQQTVDALLGRGSVADHEIVWSMRGSRTVVALVAGAGLGVAGVLVQALTRNPVAEPGILGINAGAACAVAGGLAVSGSLPVPALMGLALAGAAVSGVVVLGVAGAWRGRHDPVRVVLVGAAWSAVVSSVTVFLLLNHPTAYADFRFWDAGAVVPRPLDLVVVAAVVVGVALVVAAALSRSLDALAFGDELAQGLGVSTGRARGWAAVAAMVLCAVATSLVGPVSFLGLMAPYGARLVVGARHGPMLALASALGAALLLGSDVAGRAVRPPAEVPAAVMCAFLGAPLFVVLARTRRLVRL